MDDFSNRLEKGAQWELNGEMFIRGPVPSSELEAEEVKEVGLYTVHTVEVIDSCSIQ